MILLDHNIPEQQVEAFRRVRLRLPQIGHDVGRPEWQDLEEILRYLHSLKAGTFITRDEGFFRRSLCHPNYCIAIVSGPVGDTAASIRRFLRHATFRTKRNRMGKVVGCPQRGSPGGRIREPLSNAWRGSLQQPRWTKVQEGKHAPVSSQPLALLQYL